MPDVSVPWGQQQLTLSLPAQWEIQQIARPQLRPAPADWPDRLALALNQPAQGPPLAKLLANCRSGRIALIVEDITRHSPIEQILPILLREIDHAGIDREQLQIVLAAGMHVPMTPAQAAQKLGKACEGIAWRCNPWQTPGRYISLGRVGKLDVLIDREVATADLRIIVSSLSPHLQAGFGGGYKMLLPGCAGLETIRGLHRLAIGRRPRQLVGTEPATNAMRAAIEAAGRMIDEYHGSSFAVQYILDDQDLPAYVATGDPGTTQQMLAKQCSVACGVVTAGSADVVIANAHPRDHDLWQSFKAIANTCWSARPNGVIICTTRCEAGTEGMNIPSWPLSPVWTRRAVRTLGAEALSSMLTRLVPALAGDAAFFVRLGLQTLHRCNILLVSPALAGAAKAFPGLAVFDSADKAIAAATEMLGPGRQRVIVFPAGGTTYPALPGPAAHRAST